MLEGVELPREKFWTFATGADHDDEPYGLGLGHWCYWPTLFKRNGIKFWLSFVEKFAGPTGVGKYDEGATLEERAKLLRAVRAIQTDSGIIMPKSMEVSLLEAARGGTVDYKALHDTMDDTIAKVVIGQTASSGGTPGKLGEEKLQSDVRDDIVKADADLVCASLNDGPIKWLTRWNFPDAEPPKVHRVLEEPEDLDSSADRDTKIAQLGFKPSLKYITQKYGGEWTQKATPPALEVDPNAPPAASFAADDATLDPPDRMADQVEKTVSPAAAKWVDKVRDLVDQAQSWDELQQGIAGLIPDMTLDDYADALAQATAAAQLAGRYEVAAKSGDA
jgi:phage gp29-like protein